jgi:hypothetical protein
LLSIFACKRAEYNVRNNGSRSGLGILYKRVQFIFGALIFDFVYFLYFQHKRIMGAILGIDVAVWLDNDNVSARDSIMQVDKK